MTKQQKTTLVIIYNHNYEKNIEKLEEIYKKRFDNIYHLMPFYKGNKENVIKIIGTSYLFQDYIRQGLSKYFNDESTHYCFVGDDCILNPNLNQYNITEYLELDNNTGYIPGITPISVESIAKWGWTCSALRALECNPGCEYQKFVPSKSEVLKVFENYNIPYRKIPTDVLKKYFEYFKFNNNNYYTYNVNRDFLFKNPFAYLDYILRKIFRKFYKHECYKLNDYLYNKLNKIKTKNIAEYVYPLVYGYADFIIIPSKKIHEFSELNGIFAAANLFVEVSIPTTMLLCLDNVKFEQGKNRTNKNAIFDLSPEEAQNRYSYKFSELYTKWDKNLIFMHPVKLSKWS